MRQPSATDIITVSELNRRARFALESEVPEVWIEAEISNLARPASGHLYFSLKDDAAQVRCAMFRGSNRRLAFTPENGMAVLIHAKVGLYEPRGEFQLVVDHMEEAGEGLLRKQFEMLKQQLADEGLFDPTHKQELPELPQQIAVVTSPSGAAIRDVLHILERRFPSVPVLIYPTAVQGETAALQIARAIAAADNDDNDLIIAGRGGGSLEDLWAFNEEPVARAIFACATPLISAVGHETDFTIADLVADVRAPTPSGAAELAVPDRNDWLRQLTSREQQMQRALSRIMEQLAQRADNLQHRLSRSHPGNLLNQQRQKMNELLRRLASAAKEQVGAERWRLSESVRRLSLQSPVSRVQLCAARLQSNQQRLTRAMRQQLDSHNNRFGLLGSKLHSVSPLATLDRGYAMVTGEDGSVIADSSSLKEGQEVKTRLAKGSFTSVVKSQKKD